MPDWSDTLKERENGELVGFVGHNEAIDPDAGRTNATDEPVEDVRRAAVDATEAADVEVVSPVPQPPVANEQPAPAPTTTENEGGPAGGDSDSTGQNDPAGGQANGDGDASNTGSHNAQ